MTDQEKRAKAAKRAREWYWANRDRALAYQGEYKAKNAERIKQQQAAWRTANKASKAAYEVHYHKNGRKVTGRLSAYDAAQLVLSKLNRGRKWRYSWTRTMRGHLVQYLALAYTGE